MTVKDYIELKPILEDKKYQDLIEKRILKLFIDELYNPILIIINKQSDILKNSNSTILHRALESGKIYYSNGNFYGSFNSYISKELQLIGAKWNSEKNSYKLEESKIPFDVMSSIYLSKANFDEKLKKIDKKLEEISSEQIAEKLNISSIFDRVIFKMEDDFKKSVKNITVTAQLNDAQRKQIADEWQNNMRLYIKNFTEEQIKDLRQKVNDNVFSGVRRENLIKSFQESYGATYNKAKFWAHQETNLLMAKFKEVKYVDAGVPEYKWACVHMPHQKSPNAIYKPGEVRYSHGILEGKIFSWNDPPVTTAPEQPQRRNNPGQDYNCRCFAIPIVRFKK